MLAEDCARPNFNLQIHDTCRGSVLISSAKPFRSAIVATPLARWSQRRGLFSSLDTMHGMKVLAVDPGYGRCGVAVLEKENGKETVLYSNCIETAAKTDFPQRLGIVVKECARLLKKHAPDAVALEKLYFAKNQKTAMRVAEVRGALMSVAAQAGIPVFEYTPGEVKSAAAGFGAADKRAMAKMLRVLVTIRKDVRHDDEYDAIAVGITHLARVRG